MHSLWHSLPTVCLPGQKYWLNGIYCCALSACACAKYFSLFFSLLISCIRVNLWFSPYSIFHCLFRGGRACVRSRRQRRDRHHVSLHVRRFSALDSIVHYKPKQRHGTRSLFVCKHMQRSEVVTRNTLTSATATHNRRAQSNSNRIHSFSIRLPRIDKIKLFLVFFCLNSTIWPYCARTPRRPSHTTNSNNSNKKWAHSVADRHYSLQIINIIYE